MKQHGRILSYKDLRVAYDHRIDSIILTTGDPDLAREGWRVVLNSHTPGERILRAQLTTAGLIQPGSGDIPEYLPAPRYTSAWPTPSPDDPHMLLSGQGASGKEVLRQPTPWWQFPLGVTHDGEEVHLDLGNHGTHALIAGSSGSGKSIIERGIIQHALRNPEHWDITGIDLKRVEFNEYSRDPAYTEHFTHVTDFARAHSALQELRSLMLDRYAAMQTRGMQSMFQAVDSGRSRAQLLIIDEIFALLSPESHRTDEGRERDRARANMVYLLTDIVRLGRMAQVHVVLATQRPDATVLPRAIRDLLDNKILAGRADRTPSSLVLNDAAGADLPRIKGRGLVRLGAGAELQTVQFYMHKPTGR